MHSGRVLIGEGVIVMTMGDRIHPADAAAAGRHRQADSAEAADRGRGNDSAGQRPEPDIEPEALDDAPGS